MIARTSMVSLNRNEALRRYMVGSEEKMSGPVMRTRAKPPRVHAKVPFSRSAAGAFFKPMPSSVRSTVVMVPIATANPRICRISHTGNAHAFVFKGLFDASNAKKSAIYLFPPCLLQRSSCRTPEKQFTAHELETDDNRRDAERGSAQHQRQNHNVPGRTIVIKPGKVDRVQPVVEPAIHPGLRT